MKRSMRRILAALLLILLAAGIITACQASEHPKKAESGIEEDRDTPEQEDIPQEPDVQGEPDIAQEPEEPAQPVKTACIGDSITYGAGVSFSRDTDSYPAILQELLGEDYLVSNFGKSGRTLLNETSSAYRKEALFAESLEFQPDVVLIMLGTNDSKPSNWNAGEYETQLLDFVQVYQNLPGNPKVYLMTCCAAFPMEGKTEAAFHINASVIEKEVNPIIRRVAEALDVPLIDIYEVTKDHPEYFVDGIHPNQEGNEILAHAVLNTVKEQEEIPIKQDNHKEILENLQKGDCILRVNSLKCK